MSDELKTCDNCCNTFRGYGNVCPQCGAPVSIRQPKPKQAAAKLNYYYSIDGTEVAGPYSLDDLNTDFFSGALPATTKVCAEGTETWQVLASLIKPKAAAENDRLRAEEDTPEAKADARTGRIILIGIAIFVVLIVWFMIATEQTPEERDRQWQATLKETEAYQDRKAREKEEQWKAKNREEAARYIRNHPYGR